MRKPLARIIILLFSLLSIRDALAIEGKNVAEVAGTPMIVRYTQPGDSDDARYGYIFELIRSILDITRPEFGDYTIEPYYAALTTQRYSMLLSEGSIINMGWTSPGSVIAKSDSKPIAVDIFHGLLGYRICLINQATSLDFAEINSPEALRRLKIGQGTNWSDIPIYEHNNIPTMDAPTFEGLLHMLASNRFDCLALGANEVQHVYRDKKGAYPFLKVDSNLIIYYSFPIYFYISNKAPKLAQRMDMGFKKLLKNGDFERLFVQHHVKEIAELNLKNRTVVCIKSPYVPASEQCKAPVNVPDVEKLGSQ